MSDENATQPAKPAEPPGRWWANAALICVPLTLITSLGVFGVIGIVLAVVALRNGDSERGRTALIAMLVVIAIRIVLIYALRPSGPAV